MTQKEPQWWPPPILSLLFWNRNPFINETQQNPIPLLRPFFTDFQGGLSSKVLSSFKQTLLRIFQLSIPSTPISQYSVFVCVCVCASFAFVCIFCINILYCKAFRAFKDLSTLCVSLYLYIYIYIYIHFYCWYHFHLDLHYVCYAMHVQHFEPQGRHFANFYYYHYY